MLIFLDANRRRDCVYFFFFFFLPTSEMPLILDCNQLTGLEINTAAVAVVKEIPWKPLGRSKKEKPGWVAMGGN